MQRDSLPFNPYYELIQAVAFSYHSHSKVPEKIPYLNTSQFLCCSSAPGWSGTLQGGRISGQLREGNMK